jgi:hypothetical protein
MSQSWRADNHTYIHGALAQHLHEDSIRAEQPTWIRAPLRPHQLSLLAAAQSLEGKASIKQISLEEPQLLTRYGILADRVGAGKSLVALSLVRDPPVNQARFSIREGGTARILGLTHMPPIQEFRSEWRDLSGGALAKEMFPERGSQWHTRTAFMLVPHNVTTQWESYVREQTDLRGLFIRKTKDCDWERPGFLQDIFTADIVICSCTMLRKFMGAISFWGRMSFDRIVWSRLFMDEADTLQCSLRPGDVAARFTWFITGSWVNMLFPDGMYAYHMSLLDPADRAVLGDGTVVGLQSRTNVVAHTVSTTRDPRFAGLILRNRPEWIDKSLQTPQIIHETVMCKAPANLGILREFITPAAMEALHAGDTAGAMAALGLKPADKETLADRVTASLRGDLIQAEKILAFKRELDYSTPASKVEAIKKAEAKVERLREQLTALTARVASAETQLCPICYDAPRTTTLTPCCRNAFCLACLCECIHKSPKCPLCRAPIASAKELLVIGEEGVAEEDLGGEETVETTPTKGAALLKLLGESTADQRFLVFSAHEASFRGLRELLAAREIRCEMLQGTVARVDRLRRQFRDGTIRVLCMNARHVGAGINLEAATHVVLYHRMNAEMERQVIGRAVRFERAADLRVVHLVHEEETAATGTMGSEVIVHV